MPCFVIAQRQVSLNSNQQIPLQANAGENKTITPGESTQLGGSQSALNGTPEYIYEWTPVGSLDDNLAANPTASPQEETTYTLLVTDSRNCTATDEVTVYIDEETSIVNEIASTIKVYPNPASKYLKIESRYNIQRVIIYDLNGKVLEVYSPDERQLSLNVSSFAQGVYFISLSNNYKTTQHQVTILK